MDKDSRCGCTPWNPRNPDQYCTLPNCYYSRGRKTDNTSPFGGQLAWEDWHKRIQDKYDEKKKQTKVQK